MPDAMEVIRPVPDSHFRLVPCKVCQSEDVCYEYHPWGWRVRCQACGHTVDIGTHIRHEAQVAWNKENNNVKTKSIRPPPILPAQLPGGQPAAQALGA